MTDITNEMIFMITKNSGGLIIFSENSERKTVTKLFFSYLVFALDGPIFGLCVYLC